MQAIGGHVGLPFDRMFMQMKYRSDTKYWNTLNIETVPTAPKNAPPPHGIFREREPIFSVATVHTGVFQV